ncbi:SHOCT domain-containing protein [Lacticaseibacillus paracasei]|uniref:SHOCT domain-containing protein n=1 Tax=Lacticaseibacillus paracasei TaxID=1597 RepID=UPI001950867A|nr:SHOCT domain-containing protein [Lacticaseibacillus paracasei]MBM6413549.1 SHOCT domain-containing protein [Lacticaseibacillus paracasei]
MGFFDKLKEAGNKLNEASLLTPEEKEERKQAKIALKAEVILEEPIKFVSGHELVGASGFGSRIYQLKDNTVIFGLNNPDHFWITGIEFAGPRYHEIQTTKSKSHTKGKSKAKKHRHGLGGAVIGTILAPSIGTVAGAIVGSHSGKDKTKGSSSTIGEASTITSQIEDDSSTIVKLTNAATDENVQIILLTKTRDYQRLMSFHVNMEVINKDDSDDHSESSSRTSANPKTDTSSSSPVEEIRKYKQLLDDGIITAEEFSTKKKQLLGL